MHVHAGGARDGVLGFTTDTNDLYLVTDWNFYTGVEPSNPNMRPSKENPPRLIHAFVADYDAKIPDERLMEVAKTMKISPTYIERSLGGNARLVWVLPFALRAETYDFAALLLESAKEWLQLSMLPALDTGAFGDPTRLYCNGADWKPTGLPPIAESDLQAFFVKCGRDYHFKGPKEDEAVPLMVIEPALKEAFARKNELVFLDFITDQTENVYPMVPGGKGITEMILYEDL